MKTLLASLALVVFFSGPALAKECANPVGDVVSKYIEFDPENVLIKVVTDVDKVFKRWYDVNPMTTIQIIPKPAHILVFELNGDYRAFMTFVDAKGCVYYQLEVPYWNSNPMLGEDYSVMYGEEREFLD